MIRLRRRVWLRAVCILVSLVFVASTVVPTFTLKNLGVTKIKIVQVNDVGAQGVKMTKGSMGHGKAEGLHYRVDLYDAKGKLVSLDSLDPRDRAQLLLNKPGSDMQFKAVNPVGSQVLSSEVLEPHYVPGKGIYLSTTTGAGQGAARIEVRSKSVPKAKALKLITTGGIKTIQTTNVGATPITPTPVTPTPVTPSQPDMFLPIMLGIGAAGAAAIAVGMAAGSLTSEQWYISTPSGYQRMGGASTLGPYSSESQADSINRSYFQGTGRVYSKGLAGVVGDSYPSVWVK